MPAIIARNAAGKTTQMENSPLATSTPVSSKSASLGAMGKGNPASSTKSSVQMRTTANVP